MFYILIGSLILLAILYFLIKNREEDLYWKKRGVKQTHFNFWKFMLFREQTGLIDQRICNEQLKDVPYGGGSFLKLKSLMIKDLDLIRKVMVKDFEYFVNRNLKTVDPNLINEQNKIEAHMLTLIEGNEWKRARATLSPIFTTGKIKRMFNTFQKCSENFSEYLERETANGAKSIDMQSAFQRFTMSIIVSAVFCVDAHTFKTKDEPLIIKYAKRFSNLSFGMLLKFTLIFVLPFISKYVNLSFFNDEAKIYFTKLINDVLKNREKDTEGKYNDFLQLMLEHKKGKDKEDEENLDTFEKEAQINVKSKAEFTEDFIISNCILFLFAGFDTQETFLTWAIYELAINPDVQEKLRSEIEEALGENDHIPYETLNQLEYLDKVMSETLRKYPPLSRLDRRCEKDYKIEGTNIIIEKDVLIIIPIYAIHHDPNIWENPEKFDPERFNKEEKEKRHAYSYMPFGSGPRNCIGRRFALLESKVILAHLISKFSFEACKETIIPPKISPTSVFFKPQNGIYLNLIKIK